MRSGLECFYFEILSAPLDLLLPSAKKICPERLNWPELAGISEGALFTIIFMPKIVVSRVKVLFQLF